MSHEPLIHVCDLHKTFAHGPENICILDGVQMEASPGEGIAVVGASGCGKSTLLHLLGGLERPDQGSISYGGRNICTMKDAEMAGFRNREIGFVFQFHFLLPEFSALENVMMPALLAGISRKAARVRAEELLDIVKMKHRSTHKPGELSGGEQQRAAVARALMMEPRVLLADEPTGDLDPATGEHVSELFTTLRSTLDIAMIIVTHNMELARTMDRVLMLKGGQLAPYDM